MVLAGGLSRRMGTDKALVEIDGTPMVLRAADALRASGLTEVIVVGGCRRRLGELGLRVVADLYPGQGPLGGVITALGCLDGRTGNGGEAGGRDEVTAVPAGPAACGVGLKVAVTLPCDVLHPSAASVVEVLSRLRERQAAAAIVPAARGRPQWLHAAWRRRCRPELEAVFKAGVRAPRHAMKALSTASSDRVVFFDASESVWFRDADTPEDLPLRSERVDHANREGGAGVAPSDRDRQPVAAIPAGGQTT